jgi:hypothetical protein
MRNVTAIFLSVLILCSALVISACDSSEPEIEADFITVGFEDHSTMELTKGSPEFKEINDEAIRIYRDICDTMEEEVPPDYLERIKYNNKFVEIEFVEPPSVTLYTDEGEVYGILNCSDAIFVFTGEFAGLVLCGPCGTEWPWWGVLGSRRSFSNLEKMIDELPS